MTQEEQIKQFADSMRSMADDFESGKSKLLPQSLRWDRPAVEALPSLFNPSEDDLNGIRHLEAGAEITCSFTYIDVEQQKKLAESGKAYKPA